MTENQRASPGGGFIYNNPYFSGVFSLGWAPTEITGSNPGPTLGGPEKIFSKSLKGLVSWWSFVGLLWQNLLLSFGGFLDWKSFFLGDMYQWYSLRNNKWNSIHRQKNARKNAKWQSLQFDYQPKMCHIWKEIPLPGLNMEPQNHPQKASWTHMLLVGLPATFREGTLPKLTYCGPWKYISPFSKTKKMDPLRFATFFWVVNSLLHPN